jgi:hypothetical protein
MVVGILGRVKEGGEFMVEDVLYPGVTEVPASIEQNAAQTSGKLRGSEGFLPY